MSSGLFSGKPGLSIGRGLYRVVSSLWSGSPGFVTDWDGSAVSAPVNTVAPAITGSAIVGATLTSSTGTWTNTPTSYSYQWKAGGSNVGSNQDTYVPVVADLGLTITCTVTATNAGGSTPQASSATAAIKIDFTTGSLPTGITFTRASSAMRVNSSGVVEVVSTDVARLEYAPVSHAANGLLIEAQSTNNITRSQDCSTWGTNDGTVTANSTTSPDGTSDATKITTTVNGTNAGGVFINEGIASGTTSAAIFAKKGNTNWMGLSLQGGSWAYFDLNNGVVGNTNACTARMVPFDNGWYWCIIESATSPGAFILISPKNANGTTDSWGSDTHVASGDFIYVWQIDNHAEATMTSPIKTTGSTATRAADAASFTVPSGIGNLVYTFDDNTTQTVSVSPGAYSIPTNLNRANIKTIAGTA